MWLVVIVKRKGGKAPVGSQFHHFPLLQRMDANRRMNERILAAQMAARGGTTMSGAMATRWDIYWFKPV